MGILDRLMGMGLQWTGPYDVTQTGLTVADRRLLWYLVLSPPFPGAPPAVNELLKQVGVVIPVAPRQTPLFGCKITLPQEGYITFDAYRLFYRFEVDTPRLFHRPPPGWTNPRLHVVTRDSDEMKKANEGMYPYCPKIDWVGHIRTW